MKEQHGEFTREISWVPAFDKRDTDPAKNYGINSLEMYWSLAGPNGAIELLVMTSWHLAHVQKENDERRPNARFPYLMHKPLAAYIGFHSCAPHFEGHEPTLNCKLFDGKPCYFDRSFTSAEPLLAKLITDGEEAVWAAMLELCPGSETQQQPTKGE